MIGPIGVLQPLNLIKEGPAHFGESETVKLKVNKVIAKVVKYLPAIIIIIGNILSEKEYGSLNLIDGRLRFGVNCAVIFGGVPYGLDTSELLKEPGSFVYEWGLHPLGVGVKLGRFVLLLKGCVDFRPTFKCLGFVVVKHAIFDSSSFNTFTKSGEVLITSSEPDGAIYCCRAEAAHQLI